MPYTSPFHTSSDEYPAVYHNNSACADGQRIEAKNRVSGQGTGRRLCDECAKLNAEGK
jgi:hypothetical protein